MSAAAAGTGVSVTAVFAVQGPDEDAAYAVVAELIDRLNAVANLPECECDLDITVQRSSTVAQDGG
jgi:hypothetical protein